MLRESPYALVGIVAKAKNRAIAVVSPNDRCSPLSEARTHWMRREEKKEKNVLKKRSKERTKDGVTERERW